MCFNRQVKNVEKLQGTKLHKFLIFWLLVKKKLIKNEPLIPKQTQQQWKLS